MKLAVARRFHPEQRSNVSKILVAGPRDFGTVIIDWNPCRSLGTRSRSVESSTTNTSYTTLGLRSSKEFTLLGTVAVARGTAGWVHAFGDVDPTSTASFATGDSFTVSGTPIDQNAALLEAGLDLNLTPSSTFSLTYTGQIGKNAHENGVSAKLRMQF